jgi:hypothetical protein
MLSSMRHRIGLIVGLLVAAWGATAAERARLPEVGVPGALGVNIHFTTPRAGEMEMLAAAGFKWVRMDLNWGGTERERGKYDFGAYDRLVAALEPHGIRAIFILDYSNRLYDGGASPHTDEGREAMGRWAVAAARHFAGKGIVFEMWNEPNIGFWKPKPNADDYAKLALAVGKAMRAGAPDELYIGPATSTIDLKFLEACFKAGCLEYWDAVSVHPYRQSGPETVEAEYRKLRALIARYVPKGKLIPIISGEWGYSTGWKGFDEARQGKYLPREFLVNLCNDVPVSIFYDWHDDGTDPKESEHHFGTVHNAYVKDRQPVYDPKPSYVAMRELTTELGGLAFNKRLWTGDEADWVAVFSAGDKVKVAAWTTSRTPRTVTVPASAGRFTVARDGKRETVEAGADGLKLELTDTVAYVSAEGPNTGLTAIARWERLTADAAVGGTDRSPEPRVVTRELKLEGGGVARQRVVWLVPDPITVEAMPPVGNELRFHVTEPTGKGFTGRLELTDASGVTAVASGLVSIKPGEIEKTVVVPLGGVAGNEWAFGVKLYDEKVAEGPVVTLPRRTYRRVEAKFTVKADGDGKVKSSETVDSAPPPEAAPVDGVVRVKFEMDAGWKFEQVMPATADGRRIEGRPTSLGMWVYGDGSGCQIRARFIDAEGQTFQPDGPRVDWRGWRWVNLPMSGGTMAHWGRGDGEVQYPIRWDTVLLLDNVSKKKVRGEIWVGGVMTVE